MEYTAKKLGRGRVSGEIIAGLEPIDATKRGIDRIVAAGAFPTVCIFRPTVGSELENTPPPRPDEMREVFAHLYEACRDAGLPVGILPIEVSLVVQPEEAADRWPPERRIPDLRVEARGPAAARAALRRLEVDAPRKLQLSGVSLFSAALPSMPPPGDGKMPS